MKDPPRFSGKRDEYASWSYQMNHKMRLDSHFYEGNSELWYLIYSCLEAKPQAVVSTFY